MAGPDRETAILFMPTGKYERTAEMRANIKRAAIARPSRGLDTDDTKVKKKLACMRNLYLRQR